MPLLEVKNIKKVYTSRLGVHQVQSLENENFTLDEGE